MSSIRMGTDESLNNKSPMSQLTWFLGLVVVSIMIPISISVKDISVDHGFFLLLVGGVIYTVSRLHVKSLVTEMPVLVFVEAFLFKHYQFPETAVDVFIDLNLELIMALFLLGSAMAMVSIIRYRPSLMKWQTRYLNLLLASVFGLLILSILTTISVVLRMRISLTPFPEYQLMIGLMLPIGYLFVYMLTLGNVIDAQAKSYPQRPTSIPTKGTAL